MSFPVKRPQKCPRNLQIRVNACFHTNKYSEVVLRDRLSLRARFQYQHLLIISYYLLAQSGRIIWTCDHSAIWTSAFMEAQEASVFQPQQSMAEPLKQQPSLKMV